MKKLIFSIVFSLPFLIYSQDSQIASPSKYVDPLIGSQGDGNTFPGSSVPFGMVKLGPDCGNKRINSGYHPTENINGFSHVHVSGTGGGAKYGNILVMPTMNDINVEDYSSERKNENVQTAYYATQLIKHDIKAELTSTHSAGFHRYTFSKSGQANILIDAGSFLGEGHCCNEAQELVGSEIEIISNTQIEGYSRIKGGWNGGAAYTVYFSAIVNTPAENYGVWKDKKIEANKKLAFDEGKKTGAYFSYNVESGQEIKLKVGISFISRGKARANVLKEITDWDFEETHQNAINKWDEVLKSVNIEGGTEAQKTIFYTALYHTMLMPTDRTGENPKWTSDKPYYDDFYAIWDTFRATHPLLTLIQPARQRDIVNTLLDIYDNEGYMPDARSGNDTGVTQGGSNVDIVVADAYVKGLAGIDYEKGYEAMVKNAEVPPGDNERRKGRGGIFDYNTLGYVSVNYERAGTRTVEYANCDWAIAQVAKGLGKYEDFEIYKKRAGHWKNLWRNIEHSGFSGFIMPRNADGSWVDDMKTNHWTAEKGQHKVDFTPLMSGTWPDFFYESHSWEYSLYVPQDMKGLIDKSGGNQHFVNRLDAFFDKDYFYIWNEPGFLTPTLYVYARRHDKTAERVSKIIKSSYKSTPDGIPGNDDAGSMSAWFAFHAMGFFPNAGQDVYIITTPLFEKTTIQLENGKTFIVEAQNLSDKNIYIKEAFLNGKPLNQAWFKHTDIKNGGHLKLIMAKKPTQWGTKNPPPSISDIIKN